MGSPKVMGKLAHQKRGKPRRRTILRRDVRMKANDAETRETLRRWVNAGRRAVPDQPANDTTNVA
jgi:hypothetical protein